MRQGVSASTGDCQTIRGAGKTEKKPKTDTPRPAPPPANILYGDSGHTPSRSATTSYYAHYDDIRKHMNIQDYSRLDAIIALRMRATGHSPQSVMDAVQHCAPSIRTKEGRDWQKYAERTANYAFGVAGDVALRKYEKYVGQWQKAEVKLTMRARIDFRE